MDINKKMQDAFNAQIKEELYASHLYLQMAFWFSKEGWNGFAGWMGKQSHEEKEHAMDMAKFLVDRGGEVLLTDIPSVQTSWDSPVDVFKDAMAHEEHVSAQIEKLADVADEVQDRAAANFCAKYVDEQVEEEKTMRDILTLFEHAGGSGLALIDHIVGEGRK